MLRWSILLATLVLWLSCMALVYVHCKPQMQRDAGPSNSSTLDALFAEDAESERGSRVFVDVQKLKNGIVSADKKPAPVLWNGVDERGLTEIGWLKTTIKKKTSDATRLEQITDAEF